MDIYENKITIYETRPTMLKQDGHSWHKMDNYN